MSFDYSSVIKTASEQIGQFGRDVVIKRVSEVMYDFVTGENNWGATSQETVKAVQTDYKEEQIDGSIVKRGDKMFLISANGIVPPSTNDLIDDWKVVNVNEVKTGDLPILYKVQVRK